MESTFCWLLTDALGQSRLDAGRWLRWSPGETHAFWWTSVAGYCCDSRHLPYLLDPLYERHGPGARLWLSDVGDLRHVDPVRIESRLWTTLHECARPAWVGSDADASVRLRFALLAASAAQPKSGLTNVLSAVSLHDLQDAAARIDKACAAARSRGPLPQSTCLAATAVRSAATLATDEPTLAGLALRQYPLYAWSAGMAAACACVDLSALADDAVRRESGIAGAPARAAEVVTV
ncbi:MAG: hypothetical protein NTY65_04505 [Planctomycetota bacterium]|nr:hypothetical protein [Planctomycetota bacterium]